MFAHSQSLAFSIIFFVALQPKKKKIDGGKQKRNGIEKQYKSTNQNISEMFEGATFGAVCCRLFCGNDMRQRCSWNGSPDGMEMAVEW